MQKLQESWGRRAELEDLQAESRRLLAHSNQEQHPERFLRDVFHNRIKSMKRRSSVKKYRDVSITVNQLIEIWRAQGGKCAVSGILMTWGSEQATPTSLSIDREDSSKGYTLDNINLVCFAFNSFKGTMSTVDMVKMAEVMVGYQHGLRKQVA